MTPSLSTTRHSRFKVVLIGLALILPGSKSAHSGPATPLQLEVSVNGNKTGLIGHFSLLSDGRLSTSVAELGNFRISAPATFSEDRDYPLDQIRGLRYRYDEPHQSIDIFVEDAQMVPLEIGPPRGKSITLSDSNMIGAILNYGLVGSIYDSSKSGAGIIGSILNRAPQALTFDSRVFGPLGTFSNSGFAGQSIANQPQFVRLESVWTWSDPDTLRTLQFGDVITAGPSWSRPVRLGGVQLRRDFQLRPDLITSPMPSFQGSAAVPSTLDVFVNNIKTYSSNVEPGPFKISNLPNVSGAGTVNLVVRDATGQETAHQATFYNTPTLLKSGIYDFSASAGLVRADYGVASDHYDDRPVATGGFRYGVTEQQTFEAYAEIGQNLVNIGGGPRINFFNLGLISLAGSLSKSDGHFGSQGFVAFQTTLWGCTLQLSSQRTLGSYEDLAGTEGLANSQHFHSSPALISNLFEPPKAQDLATVSFPISDLKGLFSVSFINRITAIDKSQIVTGGYSQPLHDNVSFHVDGFEDMSTGNAGFFAGVSIALGDFGHGQVGLTRSGNANGIASDYSKSAGRDPGDIGWRIAGSDRDGADRSASVTYQGSAARTEVTLEQTSIDLRGRASIEGALVATKHGVFAANRINDGFAVIDAGAPGVDILVANRKAATTNESGIAVLPGLQPYQGNKISLDPTNLPADVAAPAIEAEVAPRGQTGVEVDLRTVRLTNSAIIVFRRQDGSFFPAGTPGAVTETGLDFVIGYDGRAFVDNLSDVNTATIGTDGAVCHVTFLFRHQAGRQSFIEAPPCNQ